MIGLSPHSNLGVYNANVDNAFRAFAERYFLCNVKGVFMPAIDVPEDRFLGHYFYDMMHESFERCEWEGEMTLLDTVSLFRSTKLRRYKTAYEELTKRCLKAKDARLSSFIKFEKQSLVKPPRVINPRTPEYTLELAAFLKHNEKHVYKHLASLWGQDMVVFKGIDNFALAKGIRDVWDSFHDPVAVGGDAVKFDMHISIAALMMEHLCYITAYCGNATLARTTYFDVLLHFEDECPTVGLRKLCWILSLQLHNTGRAYFCDGHIEFNMKGTRSSGDINTSLGNGVIMCLVLLHWCMRKGISSKLVDNGDDWVMVMERSDLNMFMQGIEQHFGVFGFRLTIEKPVDDFEQIEFCQCHPVWNGEAWVMTRNVATLLVKASMCLKPLNGPNDLLKWITAVGLCEGSLAMGVPVIQSFCRALVRNGKRCSTKMLEMVKSDSSRFFHSHVSFEARDITDESRLSFYVAFGITPDEQKALEAVFDKFRLDRRVTCVPGNEAADIQAMVSPIMYLF